MTITTQAGGSPFQKEPAPPRPRLTVGDALDAGYTKKDYRRAEVHWRTVRDDHLVWGTPAAGWEPTLKHARDIVEPDVAIADATILTGLEREVDDALQAAQDDLDGPAADGLADLSAQPEPVIPKDGNGQTYTPASGQKAKEKLDDKIARDEAAGIPIHGRTHWLLTGLAPWIPALESGGFFYFIARFLDVDLLDPQQDIGAWILSLVIVLAVVSGQWFFTTQAGRAHNGAREASIEDNRFEADRGFTRRNRFLALSASTVTLAITAGLIFRGEEALSDADAKTVLFMAFVAFTAGFVMPALTFLAVALDGSSASRERDAIAVYLDGDLQQYLATKEAVREVLATVQNTESTMVMNVIPNILGRAHEDLAAGNRMYNLVRLLIGGLRADPPEQSALYITPNDDGTFEIRLGVGVPGERPVNLEPVMQRGRWVSNIRRDREDLERQLRELPPHPHE